MRQFKFRAWDKENRTWTFVTLGDLVCGACLSSGDKPLSGAPQVWEQYTGLKDKNGKEIYEGDIVRFYYKGKIVGDFKVKYDEEVAWFLGENLVKNEDGVKTEESFFLSEYQSVRVTGNVHENDKGGK